MSRRNAQFTVEQWTFVEDLLREDWSPEQIVGWCARFDLLAISHETICRRIHADRARGGTLYTHLRVMTKPLRKRDGTYDSRGRLAGKRPISTRPAGAEHRSRFGHWEGDTVLGNTQHGACVVTMLKRKSSFTAIGLLRKRAAAEVNARLRHGLPQRQGAGGGRPDALLLRDAAPLVGARGEREHQRAHSAVPPQAREHGAPHASGLRSHRGQTEPSSSEASRLPHPRGGLCSVSLSVALQS